MAVVINELEQLAPSSETPAARSPGAEAAPRQGESKPAPEAVMAVIRREASRAERLWAD